MRYAKRLAAMLCAAALCMGVVHWQSPKRVAYEKIMPTIHAYWQEHPDDPIWMDVAGIEAGGDGQTVEVTFWDDTAEKQKRFFRRHICDSEALVFLSCGGFALPLDPPIVFERGTPFSFLED